jgi:hypothetical protein
LIIITVMGIAALGAFLIATGASAAPTHRDLRFYLSDYSGRMLSGLPADISNYEGTWPPSVVKLSVQFRIVV